MMRPAVIDLGTNTMLLLVADVSADGTFSVITDQQRIARLGKGVDAHRMIQPGAFERCRGFFQEYATIARECGADRIIATGTSALRDAANRDDFIREMKYASGIDIELLSGDDEARWTFAGTVSGFPHHDGTCAVFDIGGGSTELTIGSGTDIHAHASLDIGCVRVTEKLLHHTPPLDAELDALRSEVVHALTEWPAFDAANTRFIGVAGTVTTLAAMDLGLEEFDGNAVAGHVMQVERIRSAYDSLRPLAREELLRVVQIDPGRADVLLAGIVILLTFMEGRGIGSVTVSERGLRYGIALREVLRQSASIR